MPFDPTKPANNSPLSSAEMRAQLVALRDFANDINTALSTAVAAAIAGSSANTNAVATLGQTASGSYDPVQMQALFDKLDELILTQRR